MAVKQDIPTKTIKYKKDRSDETAELERLEKERTGILEQQKAESEDKAETETLDAEEKTFKKRYGDLRRFTQKKEEEYNARIRDLEDKVSLKAREAIQLPKSDEELAAWSKEYPEVAKVIETIASKKAKEFDASLEKRLQKPYYYKFTLTLKKYVLTKTFMTGLMSNPNGFSKLYMRMIQTEKPQQGL